ncbi:MAG: phosphodiesterase [Psychromonas sp.]
MNAQTYIFASDIHGSISATQKLADIAEQTCADKIILLGDILNQNFSIEHNDDYQPNLVAEILNRYRNNIIAVKGNGDNQQTQSKLSFPCLNPFHLLPIASNKRLFLTHGHLYKDLFPVQLSHKDIIVCGHTHFPSIEVTDQKLCINPGSLAYPRNGFRASYGILKNNVFKIVNTDGSIFRQHDLNISMN